MPLGRIRYFDIAKGLLILSLVFAHFRSGIGKTHAEELVWPVSAEGD